MVIDDKSWESIDTSILIKGNHILIRFNILKIDGKTVEFTSTLPDSLAIIDLILKKIINIANMLGRDSIKDLPLDLLENIEENLAKIIDRVKLAKEEDKDENTAVKGVNKEL
jgi:thiamine kinase-like enzyme